MGAFPAGSDPNALFLASLPFPVSRPLLVKHKNRPTQQRALSKVPSGRPEVYRQAPGPAPSLHSHLNNTDCDERALIPKFDSGITVLKSITVTLGLPVPSVSSELFQILSKAGAVDAGPTPLGSSSELYADGYPSRQVNLGKNETLRCWNVKLMHFRALSSTNWWLEGSERCRANGGGRRRVLVLWDWSELL